MVGRAMAASTRGWTSDGPGPMSVRTGGWKDVAMRKPLNYRLAWKSEAPVYVFAVHAQFTVDALRFCNQ